MEPGATERELEDLETRIERLRALYEQYFIGIEKLEPQIPRKDVERKIQILRKEQIRNTALRFKFQMLIQRYNTMQQYWARVTREIENGTFRRDVIRAANRFGAKEALTILGKKRAKQYASLAEAQAQKKGRHAAEDEVELGYGDLIEEEEERELDADDLIDDEIDDEIDEVVEVVEVKAPIVAPKPAAPAAPKPAAPKPAAPAPVATPAPVAPVAAPMPVGSGGSVVKRRVAELAAAVRAPVAKIEPTESLGGLDLDLDDS